MPNSTAPSVNQAVIDHLNQRRSYPAKLFSGPTPDRDGLMAIMETALRLPDHGKLEPWRLIVLHRADMTRLADLAEERTTELGGDAQMTSKGRGQFDLGHCAVVVISSPVDQGKVPLVEQLLSAGALCMNLLHAAVAHGWAANWLTGWPAHDAVFAARAFGCQPGETVAGIVHIGTAGGEMGPDRPRPNTASKVIWGLS